jgi:leucyl-tRNA synthetase
MRGFNVLHPMGWDAFGLPAEQYAIKTGQHPSITTRDNVAKFKSQLKRIGFSYDWQREVNTTDPRYYKWTQWIFLQIYNSYFDEEQNKARPISELREKMKSWLGYQQWSTEVREKMINDRRLAYIESVDVWWCQELGTVLANEEVIDGKSEIGGYPAVRRPMRQWMLRITAYAERLIDELDGLDWPEGIKSHQRNWIGKSQGAEISFTVPVASIYLRGQAKVVFEVVKSLRKDVFKVDELARKIEGAGLNMPIETLRWRLFELEQIGLVTKAGRGVRRRVEAKIKVFTTRPDTLYGATYLVIAPEHRALQILTPPDRSRQIRAYQKESARKSELERKEFSKEKTGVFTGAFAINPANMRKIPIWVADYVLSGYGTGAIMGVPAHDERDFEFAKEFGLPLRVVVEPFYYRTVRKSGEEVPIWNEAGTDPGLDEEIERQKRIALHYNPSAPKLAFTGVGVAISSPNPSEKRRLANGCDINRLPTPRAEEKITTWLQETGHGRAGTGYKLRDWLFSRQRYWGEPFPVVWENGKHRALDESELPVVPPLLEDYKPTRTGQPPLAKVKDWVQYSEKATRELNVMPQWAGSCWYYLRFCDPHNDSRFVGKDAERYWSFGAEGLNLPENLGGQEFFERTKILFINEPETQKPGAVDLYVGGTEHAVLHLLYARFWHKVLFDLGYLSKPEPFQRLVNQGIILGEDNQKMSKSRGNVISPDDVIESYGADAFRCYEMFMGPLEQMKPWSMRGVEGVSRFLARVWRLMMSENQAGEWELSSKVKDIEPDKPQQKIMHATIKKVTGDIEALSFNTAIAQMMIFVNAFTNVETIPLSAMRTFLVLLNPFAPHLSSELWEKLNKQFGKSDGDITEQSWPDYDERVLVEDEVEIAVQVNGKVRDRVRLSISATEDEVKAAVLASPKIQQLTAGHTVAKVVVVPKKLVNIVVN